LLAGEFEVSEQRVRKVLDAIDRVKITDSDYHLVREIRSYVAEAGFALLQVDSPRAVSALDGGHPSVGKSIIPGGTLQSLDRAFGITVVSIFVGLATFFADATQPAS
jgi:hypothetical protein